MSIYRFKKGFTIQGALSNLGFILGIIGIFTFFISLSIQSFSALFSGVFFISIGVCLAASFIGVQVDFSAQKIREYQTRFFCPFGKWEDLKQFDQIILNNGSVSAVGKDILGETLGIRHNSIFLVLLYSSSTKKVVELAEEIDYKSAKKRLSEITKQINHLPVRDLFQEKLAKSRSASR